MHALTWSRRQLTLSMATKPWMTMLQQQRMWLQQLVCPSQPLHPLQPRKLNTRRQLCQLVMMPAPTMFTLTWHHRGARAQAVGTRPIVARRMVKRGS